MTSQLTAMRDRLAGRRLARPGPAHVIAFASGRGGAGVSLLAATAAVRSAQAGMRTLLVDADSWLDVQRVWFGLDRSRTLSDLATGVDPEQLVQSVHGSLELVSFAAPDLSPQEGRALARRVVPLFQQRDVVVVDAGSRLEAVESALDLSVGSIVAVSGADAIGLAATHALLKAVQARAEFMPSVLFNRAQPQSVNKAEHVLREGVRRFLDAEVNIVGTLVPDPQLVDGLRDEALLAERLAASNLLATMVPLMKRMRPWRSS
jgi:MinD-like ATPase involved in chromosome partitioning or flagellar assembly